VFLSVPIGKDGKKLKKTRLIKRKKIEFSIVLNF